MMLGLCEDCERFDIQSFRDDAQAQRSYVWSEVRARAATCAFCQMLANCFDSTLDATWIHLELWTHDTRKVQWHAESLGARFIRVHLGERGYLRSHPDRSTASQKFPDGQYVFLRLYADEGRLASSVDEVGLRADYDVGGPAILSGDIKSKFDSDLLAPENRVITEWITKCRKHDACRKTVSGREFDFLQVTMPTRCIYVGTLSDPQLRLREFETGKTGSYITLSHRWTPLAEACSTNSDNYGQRQASMDLSAFPLHFQQAILLVRQLGVQNLWIDSICIIQSGDDGEDWKSEAPKMGDYYQHALVTFVATSSERLLATERYLDHPLVRLPYRKRYETHQTDFIYVKAMPDLNEQYQQDVHSSVVLGRGWVWQEFVLSRRIIWFTVSNVIFECQSAIPTDIFGRWTQRRRNNGTLETRMIKQYTTMSGGSLRLWHRTVREYSGLEFTRPETDRTVALLGLVGEFEKIRAAFDPAQRAKYTAALWSGYEHYELLWEQDGPAQGRYERLSGYPSWSWVSLKAKVMWCDRNDTEAARIAEATPAFSSIEVHDSGPAGPSGSRITMRTRLQTVIIDRKLQAWEIEAMYSKYYRPRFIGGLYRAVRMRSNLGGWASLEDDSFMQSNVANSADVPPEGASPTIHAVHISTTPRLYDGFQGNWYPWYRAYNVLFVRNKHDNVFERVGMGVLFGRDADVRFHEHEPQDIVLV